MKRFLRPITALPVLFFLLLLSACRREESLETGFSSVYSLQDEFGDCLGSSVVGTYRAGQALTDSSYLELTLHVAVPGRYAINTDLQNGFSFTGTGSFADTGMTTIRIPARGTPGAEGVTTLRIARDSAYCEILVNVLGAGGGSGTCNASVAGTYKKDTALAAANTVALQHTYTAAGTYTVTTDTVNGYYFNKTVTVAAPGAQSIILNGFGTPAAVGTDNFSVDFGDGNDCGFSVTVVAGTTGGGGGSGCGTVNGTYTAGTATTSANTFTSNAHVYAATGSFNVTVATTAPGMASSTATVTVTTAGTAPAITVPLSGTPTTAGTYPVNIDFGDGSTCVSSVTVAPVGGTTYFPLTQGSWWSYDDAGDTLRVSAGPSVTLAGNAYREFYSSSSGSPDDTNHVRKDANAVFQQYTLLNDLIEFGGTTLVDFPANAYGEIPLVKDFMTTGQTLVSPVFSGTMSGMPVNVRVSVTCTDANATVTINGRTFTNCYEMTTTYEFSTAGSPFQPNPLLPNPKTYFAPNVGLIQVVPASGMPAQNGIRYYQIL